MIESDRFSEPARPAGTLGAAGWTAGAVLVHREKRSVAGHYGSSAGELAACLRTVGLAWRSDLVARTVAEVQTPGPRPGGAEFDHDGWRCRLPLGTTVTLIGRPSSRVLTAPSGTPAREADASGSPGDALVVLNLIGPGTRAVLADAGLIAASGDAAERPPFSQVRVAGNPVSLLFQTLDNVLVLARGDDAPTAWHALVGAGHAYGAATVGVEAVERCLLAERQRSRVAFAI
jgi:hypothetical protein